jgi:phasin family protein
MDKKATATSANPWKNIPAALDVRRLIDKMDLPHVDLKSMVEARRRDIDALMEANREAYQALESLGKRQQEILNASLAAFQDNTRDVIATQGIGQKATRSAQHAQKAFTQALSDMRELAQMAVASNRHVLAVLNERMKLGLEEAGVKLPGLSTDEPAAKPAKPRAAATRKTTARKATASRKRTANA